MQNFLLLAALWNSGVSNTHNKINDKLFFLSFFLLAKPKANFLFLKRRRNVGGGNGWLLFHFEGGK
jgi:hypothetical protein